MGINAAAPDRAMNGKPDTGSVVALVERGFRLVVETWIAISEGLIDVVWRRADGTVVRSFKPTGASFSLSQAERVPCEKVVGMQRLFVSKKA